MPTEEATVADEKVTVTFVHPTQSDKLLQATVGKTATPKYLINQLVTSGFMEKAGQSTEYRLVDSDTKKELAPNVTLGEAQVADNAHLYVIHSVTGA
jgi:hypothetical protein